MTSLLRWNDTDRYESTLFIGSETETGGHLRDLSGWPYSVYRQAAQVGVEDIVICHGIQNRGDAEQILERLQCLA